MKKNVILLWAIIMPMISWAQARSTILSDQPEGTVLTDRVWTSDGYAVDEAQARMVPFKEKDRVAQVVTNGKKVYIKNAISHYPTGAWIEGEMNEEGTEVTFKTPQPVMINPADNSIVYVTRQVRKGTSLATETGNTDLRFAVRNDSLIQTDGGYLSLTNLAGGLYGYVDYNIVIGKQQQTITTLPASAIVYDYSMDYGEDEGRKSQAIKVGFDGNDVYIKSPAGDPNAWLKGSLNDNKIVFANSQYAGADASMGYYMYFKAARGKIDYIDIPGFGTFPVSTIELTNDESVVFDYNPADKSFMTDATWQNSEWESSLLTFPTQIQRETSSIKRRCTTTSIWTIRFFSHQPVRWISLICIPTTSTSAWAVSHIHSIIHNRLPTVSECRASILAGERCIAQTSYGMM